MKLLYIAICSLGSMVTISAQHNINSSFIQTSIGRSIKLTYEYQLNDNVALEGGLKMLIPFVRSYNQHGTFFNSFLPEAPIEYLGLYLAAKRFIPLNNSALRPFIFYNFQYSNSKVKPLLFIRHFNNNGVLVRDRPTFQRTMALEHFIGFGFNCRLYKKLHLEQKIGAGIVFFRNIDPRILIGNNDGKDWQIVFLMYSFGLSYQL